MAVPVLHEREGMTKEIVLSQGVICLVDDEDYDKVLSYSWNGILNNGHWYAYGYIPGGGRNSKQVLMHRLIMDVLEDKSGLVVDHINRDGLDNRKENLRLVPHGMNIHNSKLSKRNTSGYRGVSYRKRRSHYEAAISIDGNSIHLGCFDDPIDAAKAYNQAALERYGQAATLNVL